MPAPTLDQEAAAAADLLVEACTAGTRRQVLHRFAQQARLGRALALRQELRRDPPPADESGEVAP
jgi:hypothetical protein